MSYMRCGQLESSADRAITLRFAVSFALFEFNNAPNNALGAVLAYLPLFSPETPFTSPPTSRVQEVPA
jgi:hypothetical protein